MSSCGPGRGHDWRVVDDTHVLLRAAAGPGRERTYRIAVTCTDASGNAAVAIAPVVVPHHHGPHHHGR